MKLSVFLLSVLWGVLLFTACPIYDILPDSGNQETPGKPEEPYEPGNPDEPDEPDAPVITLSLNPPRPESGSPVTAVFTVNGLTLDNANPEALFAWQARSADGLSWESLPSETAASFLPWTEDIGRYFKVEVTYQNQVYQAETTAGVGDSLAALIGSGLGLNLMPGSVTDGTNAALGLPVQSGVRYKVAVLSGDSPSSPAEENYTATDGGVFLLSASYGGALTADSSYTVYIKAERDNGAANKGGKTLSIAAPYICDVKPRRAFSTFSATGLNGKDISEPYGNPQYRGGNSITVGANVYAVTEEQYTRLAGWCRNNGPEVRSIYNLSITNGEFADDVALTGSVSSISLYGFNAKRQTRFSPEGFTVTSYLDVEDGAVLILPGNLKNVLSLGSGVRIRVGGGGELRNKESSVSGSPWTPGLETVRWVYRWGATVYTSDYGTARAFIAKNGSGVDSVAVWETGSASNESSLELTPGAGNNKAMIRIDGKTTFIHTFTAYSDWDIKEGSKITVTMQDSNEVFDFSNGIAPDEADPAEAAKRWQLIGHTGPLPIANSYFRVDRGHLISLPGIESKVWTNATSFRWSSGRWIAETQVN